MIYVRNSSSIGGHKTKRDSLTTNFWPSQLHNPEDGHQYYVNIICIQANVLKSIYMNVCIYVCLQLF